LLTIIGSRVGVCVETFSASKTLESGINSCTSALVVVLPAPWVRLIHTITQPHANAAKSVSHTHAAADACAGIDERACVRMPFVEAEILARAIGAVTSLAGDLGLPVNETVVIHNSNKLALRLLPCDVFARIALVGQEAAALEIEVARGLAAVGGPVALLDPRVEPRVYQVDGFVVTFWTYYAPVAPDRDSPAGYADALQRLHAGMRSFAVEAPHFTERIAEAESLTTNRDDTPALAERDRQFLLSTLHSAGQAVRQRVAAEQLLHGEPHPGNLLGTPGGPVFIDFETCCIGPIEFDVAHVPEKVSAYYPGVDQVLLQECRRLVLAMVAAWRWDVHDEFPNGRQHGRDILGLLRAGPPWPTLDAL
jgi:phosphotransferase family enzyme